MLTNRLLKVLFWTSVAVIKTIYDIWHFDNSLAITFLDVGQGDSAVIETPGGKRILIDGGPDDSVLTELSIISSYFEDEFDYTIVSHTDSDHFVGVYEVNKYYLVKGNYINLQNDKLSKSWKRSVASLVEGDSFVVDGVIFEILWPDISTLSSDKRNNNKSVVLRVSYGSFCAIFTGDIEKKVEERLVDTYKEKLHCDILKVPHHGSKTSSSDRFIHAVSPKIAVISVGKENRYGHPSPEIVRRYANSGVVVWRTDFSGRFTVKTDGYSIIY